MTLKSREPTLADDLLHGAAAIAHFLGISERAARHQIDAGNIPVTRMGRLIVGSKSQLRRHFGVDAADAVSAERSTTEAA